MKEEVRFHIYFLMVSKAACYLKIDRLWIVAVAELVKQGMQRIEDR